MVTLSGIASREGPRRADKQAPKGRRNKLVDPHFESVKSNAVVVGPARAIAANRDLLSRGPFRLRRKSKLICASKAAVE